MDKQKRNLMIGGAALLALVAVVAVALVGRLNHQGTPAPTGEQQKFIQTIDLASAPPDVQDAAAKLKTSRVGYAIVHPDKTYLIMSTGNEAEKVVLDKADTSPNETNPDFVAVQLKSSPAGQSLLIATTKLTVPTEYQFDVDGVPAVKMPTLHNAHNLPLIPLDANKHFSLVAPQANALVENGVVHVEGYAQVFEAAFSAEVTTAKTRVVGSTPVKSAAGAPSWGSFSVDIPIDGKNLTETGFLVLRADNGLVVTIPIRFRRPAELG